MEIKRLILQIVLISTNKTNRKKIHLLRKASPEAVIRCNRERLTVGGLLLSVDLLLVLCSSLPVPILVVLNLPESLRLPEFGRRPIIMGKSSSCSEHRSCTAVTTVSSSIHCCRHCKVIVLNKIF